MAEVVAEGMVGGSEPGGRREEEGGAEAGPGVVGSGSLEVMD